MFTTIIHLWTILFLVGIQQMSNQLINIKTDQRVAVGRESWIDRRRKHQGRRWRPHRSQKATGCRECYRGVFISIWRRHWSGASSGSIRSGADETTTEGDQTVEQPFQGYEKHLTREDRIKSLITIIFKKYVHELRTRIWKFLIELELNKCSIQLLLYQTFYFSQSV